MAQVVTSDAMLGQMLARRGRKQKYPWGSWSDGQTWKVERGEDFTCTVQTFCAQLHNRARKTGKKVTATTIENSAVIFRFYEDWR